MTSRLVRFLVSTLFVLAAAENAIAADARCDRACLRTALDQYLDAVVKHDPSAAPLFVAFRQTENAVVQRLGTGAWRTITALGKVQRRYLDPVTDRRDTSASSKKAPMPRSRRSG